MKDIRGHVALTTQVATTSWHVIMGRDDLQGLPVEEEQGQEARAITREQGIAAVVLGCLVKLQSCAASHQLLRCFSALLLMCIQPWSGHLDLARFFKKLSYEGVVFLGKKVAKKVKRVGLRE